MNESQTPRTDAAESDQEDRAEYRGHLVPACFARELESELTATRARLAEVNGQCTELLDDLEQVTVAHAQAESRLAELEEALETVEIRYAAFQLHTETTIRERDKRLAELEGITERLYEQQNYHHPNTCLGYVGKFMADYEAYKEGKK